MELWKCFGNKCGLLGDFHELASLFLFLCCFCKYVVYLVSYQFCSEKKREKEKKRDKMRKIKKNRKQMNEKKENKIVNNGVKKRIELDGFGCDLIVFSIVPHCSSILFGL